MLLLHGSSGWRADNLELARTLTGAGYVTLTVDYYVETGGAAIGSQEKLAKWPAWQATVRAAVDVLRALPTVDRGAIALLGVSRGAFLAVSVAGSIPSVRAVVDLYGGGGGGTAAIDDEVRNMPPLLILHGEADDIVPPRFAFELRDACRRAGRTVELHTYSGVGHGFSLPAAPNWSRKATDDATRRIIRFLRRWLTAT